MANQPPNNPHHYSGKHFLLALAIVLVGVGLGSIVVIKKMDTHPGARKGYPTTAEVEARRLSMLTNAPKPAADRSWTNGMVYIPAAAFWMGTETGREDESPVHQVELDGFWMDATEVTNEQFEKFVRATGYKTIAERKPDAKDFPDAPPEALVPGSVTFSPPPGDVPLDNHFAWWQYVKGANWRHPEGPGSSIVGRERHPVVHVAWDDAIAYARWAGKRLPTEAEWERAARGTLERTQFMWGSELTVSNRWMANIWQGKFPNENTLGDGFRGTAPAGTFPPNTSGLYDMAGNVWEWVADWYRPDYYAKSPKKNPIGPVDSYDPNEPNLPKKVMRGGSFLCSDLYCTGYRPSARMKSSPDTGLSHTGFRCVKDGPPPIP